jgi:sugar/nucleoside kinase (ribokinase family)
MKNKDLNLCGLGNGLVDLQFEATDEEIISFGLKPGEMKLVDTKAQDDVLSKLGGRQSHKCSGGSAANTIIAFSKFGGKAAYKTVLGNDEYGKFYASEFKEMGIELIAPLLDSEPTGLCVVLITPDSERTMHTSLGATSKFGTEHISEELIARSEWLYIEGYKFSEPSSTEAIYKAIEIAKKYNTKIAVTFSDVFITEYFREHVRKVVEKSELVFCNENEALSFTQTGDVDTAFVEIRKLCPNVVITKGGDGSLVGWGNDVFIIPAYKTIPVDSTGAGDMLAAGFLYGVILHGSPIFGGHLASFSASKVVSQFGARLQEDHIKIRDFIKKDF